MKCIELSTSTSELNYDFPGLQLLYHSCYGSLKRDKCKVEVITVEKISRMVKKFKYLNREIYFILIYYCSLEVNNYIMDTPISIARISPENVDELSLSSNKYSRKSGKLYTQKIQYQTLQSTPNINNHQTFENSQLAPEKKMLKSISQKVKFSIKKSQQHQYHSHTSDFLLLKTENQNLQETIKKFQQKSSLGTTILQDENKYLKDFMKRKDIKIAEQNSKEGVSQNKIQLQQNIQSIQSQTGIESLKKYFITYINTVIQNNDQKMSSEMKRIEGLERRVAKLNKLEAHASHLKFQKEVKLQKSNRKSKNYTFGVMKNSGDWEYHQLDFHPEDDIKKQSKQFVNPHKKQNILEQRLQNLYTLKIEKLQQELDLLRERYDYQIESNMNVVSDRQELIANIEKLRVENKGLKGEIFTLGERLRYSEEKYHDFEDYMLKTRKIWKKQTDPMGWEKQMEHIRDDLVEIGVDRFEQIERQISGLVIERDSLRRQLKEKEQVQIKYSGLLSQLFKLKQRNKHLEQICKEKEASYQNNPIQRKLFSQRQHQQIHSAQKSIIQVNSIKWVRQMHFCIMQSVHRLSLLQKQVKNK